MKKMICEICKTQKIKKENGVFVCQDCGTEYSLEEAKKLLKEVDENNQKIDIQIDKLMTLTEENNKYLLLNHLLLWADYITKLEQFLEDFNIEQSNKEPLYFNDKSYYDVSYIEKFFYDHFDLMPVSKEAFITDVKKAILLKDDALSLKGKKLYAYNFYISNKKIKLSNSIIEMFNHLKKQYIRKFDGYSFKKGDSIFALNECGDYSGRGIVYWGYGINGITVENWVEKICIPNIRKGIDGTIYQRKGIFMPKIVPIVNLNPILSEIKEIYENIPYNLAPLYIEFYNKECKSIVDDRCKLLIELINMSFELEKTFMLPYQYRASYIIIELINFVCEGKAESWKELINLYDTTVYRRTELMKLSSIINELQKVNDNLASINQSLIKIDNNLFHIKTSIDSISNKIDKSNVMLKKISKNTFGILWDTL